MVGAQDALWLFSTLLFPRAKTIIILKKKFFFKNTVDFAQGPRAGIITCALTPLPPSYSHARRLLLL